MEKIQQIPLTIALVFLVGLVLGWLAIGWWLWPVEWIETDPWDLRPEHRRRFVGLVAEEYWRTRDVSQAKEDLAGWDDEALAELLATMEDRTSSSEERQRLAALREAMGLPESEAPFSTEKASLLPSLLRKKAIIWSIVFSALLLVAAIILAISSPSQLAGLKEPGERRTWVQQVQELWQSREEQTQEVGRAVQQAEAQQAPQQLEAQELNLGPGASETSLPQGQEQQTGAQLPQQMDQQMQQPAVQQAEAQQAPQQPEVQQPPKQQVQEKLDPQDTTMIQDVLTDVFEAEEVIDPYLEVLTEGLEDIDILDLARNCKEVADQPGRYSQGGTEP